MSRDSFSYVKTQEHQVYLHTIERVFFLVYEGGIGFDKVSIDSSGTKIIIAKDANALMYAFLIRMY